MRRTLARHWTTEERDLAARIVRVVHDSGTITGAKVVARAVGLPYGSDFSRGLRKLYDVMPLAVMLAPSMYPGKALLVGLDHTYQVSDCPALSKRVAVNRLKGVHTKLRRMRAELEPLRGNTSDMASIFIANQIDTAYSALSEPVMDAILLSIEQAERDAAAAEGEADS